MALRKDKRIHCKEMKEGNIGFIDKMFSNDLESCNDKYSLTQYSSINIP